MRFPDLKSREAYAIILNICKTDERAEEQMLKKWYAKLLVLLAVVCAVAAAHPAAQAEAIPEETAQEQTEADVTIIASGTCGAEGNGSNLRWELDSNGKLSISGSGAMEDYGYNSGSTRWNGYGDRIKSLTIASGITKIGNYAFYDCTGLTSVTFPDNLTSIGSSAFKGCTGMTSIAFPAGLTSIGDSAFAGCSGLTSITLPAGLTGIGESTFAGCSGLTSITFPDGLTSISYFAFQDCTGLTSITFPDGLVGIGGSAFEGCSGLTSVTFPAGLTSIGWWAFKNCSGLTSLAFPAGLTSIGNSAFEGCTGLTSITFPAGPTKISYMAFKGCSGLTNVTFPAGLTSIGSSTFKGCSGLTSVTLPDSLTSIGFSAFEGCSSLTSVTFPAGLTSIGSSTFKGCSGLTSVTFPTGLNGIGSSAFEGCSGLISVALPDGLTSIGGYAFSGCSGLTDISFPEALQSIGSGAFYLCSFSKVTIPASVTYIGDYGLYCGTNGGTDIYFSGNAPAVTAADSGKPSFSTDSTLYFDLEKTGWVDNGHYDRSTGKWNGYKAVAVNEGILDYGACGTNLGWKLYKDGRLSISGSGSMSSYYDASPAPWADYSDTICTVTVGAGVTSIGAKAFSHCERFTAITLPDSLTRIGKSAFDSCTGLTSITLPDSLSSIGEQAFIGCGSLPNIALPDSLTSIGSSVFSGCTGLTSVTLPAGLSSIEDTMFYGCTGLTSIVFPDGLTSIGWWAFNGCTGLTSITLPSGLTNLGAGAFAGTGITAFVSESDEFTVDEDGAVYDTSNSLIAYPVGNPQAVYAIRAGTKTIGSYAFDGAAHLTTVMVPTSVESIGFRAFDSMTELESVYFLGNAPSVDGWAFLQNMDAPLKIYYDPDTTGWTEVNWRGYFEWIKWNTHQATGVELNAKTLTLALGAQQKLTATVLAPAAPENTAVTWASADMDVAAVFADGTVLGKKAGTTTVTATTVDGDFTASCTVTVKPAPDGVMPVRLDSVCARPGNTVQVRLMLDRNPGFANLSLVIGYDADVMTLTKVENKVSGTEYTGSQTFAANPYMLTWNSGTQNCTASGTLATLTFQIKNTAAYGVYPISVSFYKGLQGTYKDGVNVNYDQSRNALPLVYVGSSAEIRSYIPGDINGDGHVDSRDVLNLLRHLSGWKGITVVEEALDVNGDGESDFQDVTDLLQYIAGWNVVLH